MSHTQRGHVAWESSPESWVSSEPFPSLSAARGPMLLWMAMLELSIQMCVLENRCWPDLDLSAGFYFICLRNLQTELCVYMVIPSYSERAGPSVLDTKAIYSSYIYYYYYLTT